MSGSYGLANREPNFLTRRGKAAGDHRVSAVLEYTNKLLSDKNLPKCLTARQIFFERICSAILMIPLVYVCASLHVEITALTKEFYCKTIRTAWPMCCVDVLVICKRNTVMPLVERPKHAQTEDESVKYTVTIF